MRSIDQKGQTSFLSIVLVALAIVGVVLLVQYFKDRNNDITIHVPKVKVEVH